MLSIKTMRKTVYYQFPYLKLNTNLLMDIIESRQKILLQQLEFNDDFDELFIRNEEKENDSSDQSGMTLIV